MNPSKNQSILAGINRILSCPKLLVTLASVIGGFFAIRHAGAGMSDDAKVKLWIGFIGAVALLLREVINAWTEQDVAAINNPAPADPPLATSRVPDAAPIAPVVSSSNPPPIGRAAQGFADQFNAQRASPVPVKAAPTAQRPPVNPNVISSAKRLPPRTILPRP